ncbi:PREDICTED: protein kinase C iota type-like isoform X1 [Papilio xuthus]|uniref:Protein kinase C iota type-like isoform X1 n=1 Tax=Papilio xuthus TaxID=66420 RepID=A0AAJ7EJU0_PAPXU|nr:PREDICTED: protein kinase C iota type-like isoform X1 [Papilio xuthus]
MMPTQLVQDNHANDVRVKTVYSGDVMITYIKHNITLEEFTQEMIAICRFLPDQVFTMKWVDEEGDPCTISTQLELDEALRLYELNRDSELTVHAGLEMSNRQGFP